MEFLALKYKLSEKGNVISIDIWVGLLNTSLNFPWSQEARNLLTLHTLILPHQM